MCQKLLGQNFMQFVCQNILHIHARRHPQKRLYVKNENNPHSFGGDKNNDFQKFLKLSQENIYKLRTGRGKFQEYDDLKKICYWNTDKVMEWSGVKKHAQRGSTTVTRGRVFPCLL